MAIGTSYQFLPWVRRGLAVALDSADTLGPLPARALAHVGVRLAGAHAGEAVAPLAMQLYGPGDVLAIDTARVVRTDPRPGITNFEPNYLAIVEFDPPDLPWMLTPASANADDRLRPWLVLVVLETAKVGRPRLHSPAPLPQIRIGAALVAGELPPLAESWSWAHAQVVSEHAAGDIAGIQSDLQADPRSNISRLVCPRRLKPDTDYIACVVPAFEPGRLRGLGLAGDGSGAAMQTLAPAWDTNANADVVLPVYYHWEFSTGPQGDFEYLARKLRSPKKWKNDAQMAALLAQVGTAPMSVDDLLNADAPGQLTTMEGALVPLSYQPGAAAVAVHAASLAAIVNTPAQQVDNPVRDEADGRVRRIEVKPPLYGAWHAGQHSVSEPQAANWWLAGLNLNPRYRGAAGYGAEVVRKYQEDYVDACWDQVGEIRKAEMLLNFTRLAIEVQRALKSKHLDVQPPERLLQLMGPALPRIEALGAQGEPLYKVNGRLASLGGQIDRSSLPASLVDSAMRRTASPQRRSLRVAAMRGGTLRALPALGPAYVATMAAASVRGDAFAVNRFVADGILGTRFFDGVALPGTDDARVDLRARGLRGALTAGQVRAALAAAEQAKGVVAAHGVPAAPKVRPAQHLGIFTDLHVERFGTLAAGAVGVGAADLGVVSAQVEALGRRGVEGFLVEAQTTTGALQFSALRIDARSGALRIDRPLLRLSPQRAAQPPSRAAVRALGGALLGTVGVGSARRYGNLGLVANLPPNAVDLQGGNLGVAFDVSAGLEITRVGDPPAGRAVRSVTLPPALRQRAVLKAFAEATRGVQQAWREPFDAMRVAVQVVDFPLAQAAQVLRARTAPELTLKARLQSQLALAGKALDPASPFVAAHLPQQAAAAARLRLAIAPRFDRVMAYPHLNEPMYAALANYDAEAFMPGIGRLPPDLIMLVQVNQYFVDSFMVGANFEMNRELLWRAFPTDLRGTPFQRFWDRRGSGSNGRLQALPDMEPIHCWGVQPLGQRSDPNITDPDRVALLIKGQLLLRYPNALVYAWKRRKNVPPEQSKLVKNPAGLPPNPATDIHTPVFAGFIRPDITFFGFDIDRDDIDDWCFVVEEQMSEPRFGFDVPVAPPGAPGAGGARIGAKPRAALSYAREQFALGDQADPKFKAFAAAGFSPWKTLSWSQLPVAAGAHLSIAALAGLSQPGNQPFASFPGLSATPTAAEIAQKLLQEPFRAYWEGPDLAT